MPFDPDKYLAPWEHDGEGKKLDEPAPLDADKLKKYLIGLLTDKEKAQEARELAESATASAKDELTELQRQNENEEQRRAREAKETETRYAKLEKEAVDRRKVEAIEAAFEKDGITSARAKRLAKRIGPDVDEKAWVAEAKELVEDGFRVNDEPANDPGDGEPAGGTLVTRPRVRRSDNTPVQVVADGKAKSVGDELDAAGIGRKNW